MKMRYVISGVVLILIVVGVMVWIFRREKTVGQYRTAKIERGTLVQTVRATGVVQPVKLVQVGTQVNGPVRKLYVDYNDQVKEGDLVAQIDPTVYEAQLARDDANLKQSSASVEQTQAKLVQVSNELVRATELARRDMVSQAELDTALADRDSLAAQLKVAEAAVDQSKAALRLSRANLGYTTIRSPVDGVVIARNVDEGQTVVASMSAQTLFSIATDLNTMQIETSVPEADIAGIKTGKTARFRVDAFEETFTGVVQQIRLSSAAVQNVVTYPVILHASNPQMKLFPGMTANVDFEVASRTNCLIVPNAALRFTPESAAGKATAQAPAPAPASGSGDRARGRGPRVWIQPDAGAAPTSVVVRAGITDGSQTEIREPTKLRENDAVLTGIAKPGVAAAETVNPFMPKMPGGRR